MKNKLKTYLQEIFEKAPRNSSNDALFEEAYGNLCDRYDELIGGGMSENEAYTTAISEIGDLRPLIDWEGSYRREQTAQERPTPFFEQNSKAPQKQRLAPSVLRRTKHMRAWALAVAVFLYIVWIATIVLWDAIGIMFFCVAIGTVILVLSRTRIRDFWDDSRIVYDPDICRADDRAADLLQAVGIALCILCVAPAAIMESDLGAALMFVIVAIGVGMILLATGIRPRAEKNIPMATSASEKNAESTASVSHKRHNRWMLPTILVAIVLLIGSGVWMCIRYDFELGFYVDGDAFDHYTNIGDGSATAPVRDISVYWYEGAVDVSLYDGEVISLIEVTEDGTVLEEKERVHWGVYDGRLSIRYNEVERWRFKWGGYPEKQLTLLIPQSMLADLQSLCVETAAASISVHNITLQGGMVLESASGQIAVNNCAMSALEMDTVSGHMMLYNTTVQRATEIDTVSGSVTARECDMGEVKMDTVSGNISLMKVEVSSFDGDSTSGNLYLELVLAPSFGFIDCDTMSGDVTLALPMDCPGFILEYDTTSGVLSSEMSLMPKGALQEYNGGGFSVDINTTSGDLKLTIAS